MSLTTFLLWSVLSMGQNDKNSDEMKFCTMDVKACPDGSFVGRDPENDCKFKACPSEEKSESSCGVNATEKCSKEN